jgi:hypothetical protein
MFTFAVFIFLFGFLFFSEAQTRNLEDMQAGLRADVRREMGLDSYAAPKRQVAVETSPQKEKLSSEKTIDMPLKGDAPKIIIAVVASSLLTGLFMKLFGRKKKKQEAPVKARAEERGEREMKEDIREQEKTVKERETKSPGQDTAIDIYEKIEKLQSLKEKGILSEAEFTDKKKELLNRI